MKYIHVKGARIHNLKDIDVRIPKDKLTVITGVSGSGKSSLVFDILFEEGKNQYLKSIGVLPMINEDNHFDQIIGIGPTVAVQQNIVRQSNPRSTVGSRTSVLNLLAILYASEGKMTCSSCGTLVNHDLSCENCGDTEEYLDPSYFSYNAPNGMCLRCSGRGQYFEIDMKKLVPDKGITLAQIFEKIGASPGYAKLLRKHFKEYLPVSFSQIPDDIKHDIIYGHYTDSNYSKRSICLTRIFEGVVRKYGRDPGGFYRMSVCTECDGFRIGDEARRILLSDRHIGELGKMTISELQDFLEELLELDTVSPFGHNLINEILNKINRLIRSRLEHLSLYREMPTLSGGEIQRLFLNNHLDSSMDSLIYILDEPTVGLHESEKMELLEAIQELKHQGNTVIVVEHDRKTIEMADHIIDVGPRAGIEGGEIIYQGDIEGLLVCKQSITGQYLSDKVTMPTRNLEENTTQNKLVHHLIIRHARTHNLKDVTVKLPLGQIVGIAGVSGSGKSSLISDTLVPLLKSYFSDQRETRNTNNDDIAVHDAEALVVETIADKLEGVEYITGYVEVSQEPIGRHMTSNPASYIGIWSKIRKLFALQPDAKQSAITAGHFSFNSKGACSVCNGSGREKMWLGANLNIYKTCEACNGKRYSDESLAITYKNKTISDILEMSVSDAVTFFEDKPSIISTLRVMEQIGMGYIQLGQPTPTLSGGEAQRIKLAKEIGRRRKGSTLYILDEPTVGLSLYDTDKLIQLLQQLVAQGNSVIVIEHDLDVLSACDWIVELGSGSGINGGMIIAEGQPMLLNRNPESITGQFLSRTRRT
ncbi:MAG: excinuclease ABC subunit UvrA [Chloroflexota bacterium]